MSKALLKGCELGELAKVKESFTFTPRNKELDVNKSIGGKLALVNAVRGGELPIVKYLVEEQGADVSLVEQGGRFHSGETAVLVAVRLERTAILKYLIEKGSNVDQPDKHGLTPLHLAVSAGNIAIAKCLMEQGGADFNARTPQGQLPIDLAETEEIRQIIRDEQIRRKNNNNKNNNHGRKRGNPEEHNSDAPVAKKGNGRRSNGV